ncbi:TPA: hypothetical protein ACH3X1_002217 [Trebouxia sp. C0004]
MDFGCHSLPIAAGRFAGAAHVPRAHRVCLACTSGAVGDEMHLVFECTALTSQKHEIKQSVESHNATAVGGGFAEATGGTSALLLNTMDSQLEEVRHRIRKAEDEIVEIKQDLAIAKQAGNRGGEEELIHILIAYMSTLQSAASDFEAGLAEALLGEGPPSKKAKTGVADLGREEIAALINKKLPTASSYSKTTGGWADSRYKTIRPCMNFHRQHTLQDQRTTPVALLDTSWHLGTSC